MKLILFTVLGLGLMVEAAVADGDAVKGEQVFKKCAACHSATDKTNKVGPFLFGVFGRKAATVEGYNYSDANKGSGITWNEESFLDYIKDPKAKIPNTKMSFAGIKNESEAKNLWAYLKQYDADGKTK